MLLQILGNSKIIQVIQFLASLTKICTLYLVETQVQSEDSDMDVGFQKNSMKL